MKWTVFLVSALVFLLLSAQVFGEYNKEAVVKVTRDNVALMGKIKAAAGNRVFNASWDATYDEFVNTAYKGIGACGEKDLDRLNAAIAELGALNKKWHSQFR